MCGIVGMFGASGNFDMETLEKATSTLYHRGPDGRKHWMSEDGRVGLGHTRLSIIDLEGGTQPLSNEDGSIRAVVNGEIYDFERICNELQAKGHCFKTASDSEVLIHLYEDLGLDAIHHLRGEFAFIIWDSKTQRLIAGRDRFGIKPLYYSHHYEVLYLASEVKALLAAGVQARWDEESLYISSHLGSIPMQSRSLFKGVFQVPPGHMLVASENQERLYRYWDFDYPLKDLYQHKLSDEDSIEMFRNYFEEAVKLRLRADVPVGVYLSGGIDSCSILGTAAKFRGSGMKAFSICFLEEAYNEAEIAREMAEFAGAEFSPVMVTPELIAKHFVESIKYSEILSVNSHSVAKFILSKHVRDSGYKTVLTGEGSDEILAGYPHFRQDVLLYDEENRNNQALFDALLKNNEASRGMLIAEGYSDEDSTIKRRLGFVPSWIEPLKTQAAGVKKMFKDEVLSKYAEIDAYGMFLDDLDIQSQLRGRHILNQSMYLWSKLFLPGYLLSTLGDRMEMGHSIEGRVPFLDHKLVEFATTIPTSLKIHGMTEKYILREAVCPVVSQTVYQRQKHPFVAPPSAGDKEDPLFKFISEYVGDHLNELPFFDKHKIAGLLSNLPTLQEKERKQIDPFVTVLASIVAMQEQFGLKLH